jgi:hypothetical protein
MAADAVGFQKRLKRLLRHGGGGSEQAGKGKQGPGAKTGRHGDGDTNATPQASFALSHPENSGAG